MAHIRNSEEILYDLASFLPETRIRELRFLLSDKTSICICLVVSDIVKTYLSNKDNEESVYALLAELCIVHFTPIITDDDSLTAEYLMQKHPISYLLALELLEFARQKDITKTTQYGDGTLMFAEWKAQVPFIHNSLNN